MVCGLLTLLVAGIRCFLFYIAAPALLAADVRSTHLVLMPTPLMITAFYNDEYSAGGVRKGGSKGAVAPLDLEAIRCFSIV